MNKFDCNSVQEVLVDYADGELTGELREQIDEHLGTCDSCAQQLQLLEESLQIAQDIWAGSAAESHLPRERGRAAKNGLLSLVAGGIGVAALVWLTASVFLGRKQAGDGLARNDQEFHEAGIGKVGPSKEEAKASSAAAESDMDLNDIAQLVANETRAARLAVSAEMMAGLPSLEQSQKRADTYIASNFADSTAGRLALRRLATGSNSKSEDTQ